MPGGRASDVQALAVTGLVGGVDAAVVLDNSVLEGLPEGLLVLVGIGLAVLGRGGARSAGGSSGPGLSGGSHRVAAGTLAGLDVVVDGVDVHDHFGGWFVELLLLCGEDDCGEVEATLKVVVVGECSGGWLIAL